MLTAKVRGPRLSRQIPFGVRESICRRSKRSRWVNPIQTGLFEGFLTIVRQLKDIVVKGGFLRTTSGF